MARRRIAARSARAMAIVSAIESTDGGSTATQPLRGHLRRAQALRESPVNSGWL